ncbi:hypothetical protein BW12_07115 [Bifidobacterium sp. UTCIF-3]|uniref:hypothetical protein n=1 Tax=unclassified Bifidobacterium TaxID=2608897 RepID=UPI001127B5C6|nr:MULTISPECIES: hypothetical protein [unclassified Bifidobacterium]TPF78343.1 hypothetical protein BW09_04630 [Bifidobacterium sp. UTCIF-1]TPF81236.1 hypothetical protein BW08_00950 [Bifidobacterium sp. UTCIF-24]TPF82017.1 hypothetical protein BW12_07115 [Bifidobacterium sp. UTCIF-3]TPF85135.1 hypothetical protein BW07_00235 [Bifidobacterium sp. UTCIF-36]
MTRIHISMKKTTDEGLTPVTGQIRFIPRRHIDSVKNVITREPFEVTLADDGTATVDLQPTNGRFVWHVIELPGTATAYDRYVEVPDSTSTVEYADLVDVDPSTLLPAVMGSVRPVKMLPPASSLEEAEALSAKYPDYLVWYPENTTRSKATALVASLEQLQAQALTSATMTSALHSQAMSDASVVSDAANAARTVTVDAANARASITAKTSEAFRAIDAAVQQVQDKAADATESGKTEATESDKDAVDSDKTDATQPDKTGDQSKPTVGE